MFVEAPDGTQLGRIERRFNLLVKKYTLYDDRGVAFATIKSPLWKLWTFPIYDANENQIGQISKKWTGLLQEYFTDADNFIIDFGQTNWTLSQRAVLLGAAVSVDFDFFENNQANR